MQITEFHIFANAALGNGLSGSDRIFIELSKRIRTKSKVFIHVCEEGQNMCSKQSLKEGSNLKFSIIKALRWCKFGFAICYAVRIILSVRDAFRIEILDSESTVFYSASEFWMDSLPALVLKLRFPKSIWVATWFQTAPNPLKGFTMGKREEVYRLSAFYYWLMQFPVKPIIKKFADLVLVNNEEERNQFPILNKKNKVLVMLGAVNFKEIENWTHLNGLEDKVYDGVFQGRLHPQKGIVELIEIWKLVTEKLPNAKLALIGDGPLMTDVKRKVEKLGLSGNVKLFGYIFDGPQKYDIFTKSKIVLHPAFYDSGGMAAAEAMAFGIPCIGFDLESYKSYYPKGMVKVAIGNMKEFAGKIVELIEKAKERNEIGREAQKMVRDNWSWDQRSDFLMESIKKIIIKR